MRRNKSKDDIAKLVRTEQRKTRKRYTCQICCMDILPGSQRMLYTYKSSAGYITFSNHIHCDALLRAWDKKYESRTMMQLQQTLQTQTK